MSRSAFKFGAFCIALVLFTSAPIWGVQYFINQDGSGHVHSAWMMLEMLRGNPRVSELYQFNLLTYPNVSGHWLLGFLLLFTSAFTATKIVSSISFLGIVAGSGWLRWCTNGRDGLVVSLLIGAAAGFNWLWLQGAYNFLIGLSLALAGAGFYFRWHEKLTARRVAVLSAILAAAFLSHVIAFAILCFAIAMICVVPPYSVSARKVALTAAALVPVAPMVVIYLLSSEAGGRLEPVWRSVEDPSSITQWVNQIRSVDPIYIMRRSAFPFLAAESLWFAIFSPLLWIGVALACLIGATLRRAGLKDRVPLFVVFVGLIVISVFAPDDLQFSNSTGGIFRERIFLAGVVFAIPLFCMDALGNLPRWIAVGLLSFVVVFQTAAVWEFAIRSDKDAREFFSVSNVIPPGASVVAVTVEPDAFRFMATPTSSMNNYNGIRRQAIIWDNYEFGHYLFPLVPREKRHQEFVLNFTRCNAFVLKAPLPIAEQRLIDLEAMLASGENGINTLILWGSEPRIDAIVSRSFATEPVIVKGRVKLFRR